MIVAAEHVCVVKCGLWIGVQARDLIDRVGIRRAARIALECGSTGWIADDKTGLGWIVIDAKGRMECGR